MEIVERSIILSFDELRILLYSQGYRSCEGVYMPEKNFSQTDIIRSLRKLTENGLLRISGAGPSTEALPLVFDADGNGDGSAEKKASNDKYNEEVFFIRKDLLRMINIIGDHKDSELITCEDGRRLFCYYSEDGIVTSERHPGRPDAVRLSFYSADEFDSKMSKGDGWI